MNKNFGQTGVAQDVEFGKNGLNVKTSNGYWELMLADGSTLAKVKIGDGVDATDAVNKGQLDDKLDITKVVSDINALAGNVPDAPTVLTAINTAISDLVDGAPDALNTLNELAAALNDDEVFATTVTNLISANSTKVGNLETLSGVASGSTDMGAYTEGIITANGTAKENIQDVESAVKVLQGSLTVGRRKIPFNFESVSPLNIENAIPTGAYIRDVCIKVEVPFDDIDATLEIGKVGATDMLMPSVEIDLQDAGIYDHVAYEVLTEDLQAIATIVPDTSTQGSGYILIEYC